MDLDKTLHAAWKYAPENPDQNYIISLEVYLPGVLFNFGDKDIPDLQNGVSAKGEIQRENSSRITSCSIGVFPEKLRNQGYGSHLLRTYMKVVMEVFHVETYREDIISMEGLSLLFRVFGQDHTRLYVYESGVQTVKTIDEAKMIIKHEGGLHSETILTDIDSSLWKPPIFDNYLNLK